MLRADLPDVVRPALEAWVHGNTTGRGVPYCAHAHPLGHAHAAPSSLARKQTKSRASKPASTQRERGTAASHAFQHAWPALAACNRTKRHGSVLRLYCVSLTVSQPQVGGDGLRPASRIDKTDARCLPAPLDTPRPRLDEMLETRLCVAAG